LRANLLAGRLPRAVFLVFALFLAGKAQAEGIGGRYCGKLFSGGALVEVVTILAPGKDGRLEGVYSFREGDAMVDGKLQEERVNGLTRTLVWTDKYGSGRLLITFTGSYDAFRGAWGVDNDLPSAQWDGARCSMSTVEHRQPGGECQIDCVRCGRG
jgi:hypothetical protein